MAFIYNSKSLFTLGMPFMNFITSEMLQLGLSTLNGIEDPSSTTLQMRSNWITITSDLVSFLFLVFLPLYFFFHRKLDSSFKTMGDSIKWWIATNVILAFYYIIFVFPNLRWIINILTKPCDGAQAPSLVTIISLKSMSNFSTFFKPFILNFIASRFSYKSI